MPMRVLRLTSRDAHPFFLRSRFLLVRVGLGLGLELVVLRGRVTVADSDTTGRRAR